MFDSGISVKEIIEELNKEVDIALPIPNKTYVTWLNSLQQLLYGDVIKEQKKTTTTIVEQLRDPTLGVIERRINPVPLSSISIDENQNQPIFEDICAVFIKANGNENAIQLMKSTITSGNIFPNTFYKDDNNIGYNIDNRNPFEKLASMTIVYYVKPALVTVTDADEINDANVMLPVEFIDLVKAKLRGEAYKLANEDDIAAKWLNDYNTLLETFKVWVAEKSPNLGL
jgi:hypothetical protein